jgi:hypothetical protein
VDRVFLQQRQATSKNWQKYVVTANKISNIFTAMVDSDKSHNIGMHLLSNQQLFQFKVTDEEVLLEGVKGLKGGRTACP